MNSNFATWSENALLLVWRYDVVLRCANSVFLCRNMSSKWHFGGFRLWVSYINDIKQWQIGFNSVLSKQILEICRKLTCLWCADSSSSMINSMKPKFGMYRLQCDFSVTYLCHLLASVTYLQVYVKTTFQSESFLVRWVISSISRNLWRSNYYWDRT